MTINPDKEEPIFGAVVVAAGVGSRMGTGSPKQYELIGGKTMLERSVQVLLDEPRIKELVVVISPADMIGQRLTFEDPRVRIARVGGQTRADSVKNGILFSNLKSSDWVLVHDAARPCLLTSDVTKLMDYCRRHQESAILAVPVNDTLKKEGDNGTIAFTVSRDGLWAAQTPQCFPVGELTRAMNEAGSAVTDEASAMEFVGKHPALVEGTPTNIKVTRPIDLWLARAIFLARKEKENNE